MKQSLNTVTPATTKAGSHKVSHRWLDETEARANYVAIVDLVQSQGGVMTLEDLAECEAEVIQPIKYEYKAKDGKDGVSLWEVSSYFPVYSLVKLLIPVPAKWTGSDGTRGAWYHRSARRG